MRITLLQTDIAWADKQTNFYGVESSIKQLLGKSDMVILPEMFSTGFCTDNVELGEPIDGETVCKIKEWAIRFNISIVGSYIACDNKNSYNRAFIALPNGEFNYSDKRHLFSIGGEDRYFTAGNERLIVNYLGFNICLLVCYDIRFPVWSRNVNNEYDLLIYVANFPKSRIAAWDTLLKARAIENMSFVCGVNRVGTDGLGIDYSGHSALIDYKGEVTANFNENENGYRTVDIDLEKLKRFRNKSPFWRDSDIFLIK